MREYDHTKIEKKWQKIWEKKSSYRARENKKRPKFYSLIEFPYPSGEGLHVGHIRSNTAMDIISRKRRAEGFEVLYPIGWDAFGLPTENYAIKTGVHPTIVTKKNTDTFRRQLKALGFSFDWSREINTTDPKYYKWTQWIFLELLRHGLAYKKKMAINWCPKDKIGLANEEVIDGKCERCGTPVEKREKEQWMLAITKYADRLDKDLDTVDYLEKIKIQQRNWIGKSEGAKVKFKFSDDSSPYSDGVEVFTTRVDTIFSGTFIILSPEHPLISALKDKISNWSEVEAYCRSAGRKTEADRTTETNKTGVALKGISVINPATQKEIAVWVSDFVLAHYGTGAVFADAHDKRDFEMAKKFGIPLTTSIKPADEKNVDKIQSLELCYEGEGILVNSGQFDGLTSAEAREKITTWLSDRGLARKVTTYKLRDWIFSRQHYWGEPIPVVFCGACSQVKQKVLLIHGFEGSAEGNWFPWMKGELEKRGFEIRTATMSTSKHPVVDEWMKELTPLIKDFGRNDIIIGHSLGSKAALHLALKTKKHIGHLLLVASAIGALSHRDWEKMKREWSDSDVDALRRFWLEKIDLAQVSKYAEHVRLVISRDDDSVPLYTHDEIPRNWGFDVWDGYGHFQAKEIPELLAWVLRAQNTGWMPVPEKDLPVKLPAVKKYQPTDTGESPLASISKWVNTKCPRCGGPARRETDTMPNWAGSSWYYLRYTDPKNMTAFAARKKLDYWTPVDWYNGGMEHTTLHLLYSRFWHKFLYDRGLVPTSEPYKKRTSHGLILAEGGVKMSKSKGNVINPDSLVETVGADALRLYEMFMGPFDQSLPWSADGVVGTRRFLEKVWRMAMAAAGPRPKEPAEAGATAVDREALTVVLHRTIKKVSEDIEAMRFNTAVSQLMIFANELERCEDRPLEYLRTLLRLLAPFAPHITEELWLSVGGKGSVHDAPWPVYDPAKLSGESVTIVVQINGKRRSVISVSQGAAQADIEALAKADPAAQKWFAGGTIGKVIFVKDRLINFVMQT